MANVKISDNLVAALSNSAKLARLSLGHTIVSLNQLTLICLSKPFGFTFVTSEKSLLTLEQVSKMFRECCPKGGNLAARVKCL